MNIVKSLLLTVAIAFSSNGSHGQSKIFTNNPIDALGSTNWYQGCYPTDVSMPEPKFPYFQMTPISEDQEGVTISLHNPLNKELEQFFPRHNFVVTVNNKQYPFYCGEKSQIAYRTSNLICLNCSNQGVERRFEAIVYSHKLIIARTTIWGRATASIETNLPTTSEGELLLVTNNGRVHGIKQVNGKQGIAYWLIVYDAENSNEFSGLVNIGEKCVRRFDAQWKEMAAVQSIEPFLNGTEKTLERNLTAAMVNRVLRNQRMGGQIDAPSAIEFYGPEWANADCIWIWFQPATLHSLWIKPEFISNTIRNIFKNQHQDGFLSQITCKEGESRSTQNPNISGIATNYYRFTGDKLFLKEIYAHFSKWYSWWIEKQTPDGNGIFTIGREDLNLMEAIYEYGRDNHPDAHGIMPLMDVNGVDGRPNRLFLPDIIACQARMAEDLAFMAKELGNDKQAKYYLSEYQRVKKWVNDNMWDEKTQWYYPVIRATGEKVMKRSCTAFWLMWAGIPNQSQATALIDALFDPAQFYTVIPVPQIALNDPTFNVKCRHWGDGNVWPIDLHHTFIGLLRYEQWPKAFEFAKHANQGIFNAIKESYQPNEYYYHDGTVEGCPIMGVAGNLPLTFKRFIKDYLDGNAQKWQMFAPKLTN